MLISTITEKGITINTDNLNYDHSDDSQPDQELVDTLNLQHSGFDTNESEEMVADEQRVLNSAH